MQPDPQRVVLSWSTAKTLVVLTFVGVALVAVIVGPAKFVASAGLCLVTFPILLTFASGSNPAIPPLPGWLLVASYALPVLWLVSLWLAGTRAWDRDNSRAGFVFLGIAALGIAVGLLLASHGSGTGLQH